MKKPVIQEWVCELTYMQQSVLLSAIRGPDGIEKNHVSKLLLRWLRRCILMAAFENKVLSNPYDPPDRKEGGSFTGASCKAWLLHDEEKGTAKFYYSNYDGSGMFPTWQDAMSKVVDDYLQSVDMLPHHFQLHFMHAAEILGYKHPDKVVGFWWYTTYLRLVNDMHLFPESGEQMDKRLGDIEAHWREREEVTAK